MNSVAPRIVYVLLLALLPTSAALFRIYVHQDAVQLGYALSSAERHRDQLQGRLRALQVEVAAARSPGHLSSLAKHLGMRPPTVAQVVSGHLVQAHLARADLVRARHAGR